MTQTLVQRRRDLLRTEIAKVGIELFVERGFDAVTVDEISAAAEISPRTFFRYFDSKDDIVLDLTRRLDDRLIAAAIARPSQEGPITAVREAFRSTSKVAPVARARVLRLAAVLGSVPELQARAQGERLLGRGGLLERLGTAVAPRCAEGRERDLSVALCAMVAVAGLEFERWASSGGRGDPSKGIVDALTVLESGLGLLDAR